MRRPTSTEASRDLELVAEEVQAEAKAAPERTLEGETGNEGRTAVDKGDLKERDQMETAEGNTELSTRKAANVEAIAMTSDRTGTKRKGIPTQRPTI
jgi:hypothetical protein